MTTIQISHKIEIAHPSNKFKTYCRKAFGISRLAYNWALGRILEHENQKEKEFTLEEIEEMYRKCKLTCPPYYCGEKKSFL